MCASNLKTVTPNKKPEFISTRAPFSNFSFIEEYFMFAFYPLQRILSQMRVLNYKTIVLEEINSVGYSAEEDDDLQRAGFKDTPKTLTRLSYFSTEINSSNELSATENSHFLGYAVVKKVPCKNGHRWIVFESVSKASRYANNYINKQYEYAVAIDGNPFRVRGVLYCQQNTTTSECAHVALRTFISMLNEPKDFSCSKINKILLDGGKPHLREEGLDTEQIQLLLNKLDIPHSVQIYNYEKDGPIPPLDYQHILYGSVESGYPALLGFSTEKSAHIIPVIGHTFNEDTWAPDAASTYFKIGDSTKYIPSELWVSNYLCHDDNFGSYYCIPRQYLRSTRQITVIAATPYGAKYDAIVAEALGLRYLYMLLGELAKENKTSQWARRLVRALTDNRGRIVLRAIYMHSDEYIKHLSSISGWDDSTISPELIAALKKNLKENLCIVEISLPELFPANRRKLGEIVLNPNSDVNTKEDTAAFRFARILGKTYFMVLDEKNHVDIIKYHTRVDTHTQLYSNIGVNNPPPLNKTLTLIRKLKQIIHRLFTFKNILKGI